MCSERMRYVGLGSSLLTIAASSGMVSCVTISSDQTYIAVGHVTGNIHLYDLASSSPIKPARTTLALTLKQVLSGRKEGHLQGSRILHLGFVGKRHTSIISGDEDGRALWSSLGKVVGVESNDVVRMLGSYPPDAKKSTLYAAMPLPLGAQFHTTDDYHLTALLTPGKLVVVGMKPGAKTWYRKMRDVSGEGGCAAWLRSGEVDEGSDPVLAYSWGQGLRFLRVKVGEEPEFVQGERYTTQSPIRAMQWYDPNVSFALDSLIVASSTCDGSDDTLRRKGDEAGRGGASAGRSVEYAESEDGYLARREYQSTPGLTISSGEF
jgi:hypothetical protein